MERMRELVGALTEFYYLRAFGPPKTVYFLGIYNLFSRSTLDQIITIKMKR